MPIGPVRVYVVPGVGSRSRALVYLEAEGDAEIDVAPVLRRLISQATRSAENEKRIVLERFDHWVGKGHRDRWHHGWPQRSEFHMAYVFKWDHPAGKHRRLYGFLLHPTPAVQICVLCVWRTKDTEQTDQSALRKVKELSLRQDVMEAVRFAIPHRFRTTRGTIQ